MISLQTATGIAVIGLMARNKYIFDFPPMYALSLFLFCTIYLFTRVLPLYGLNFLVLVKYNSPHYLREAKKKKFLN